MAGTATGAPVAIDADAYRRLQNAEVMLRGAYMRVHDARVVASLSASPVTVDLAAAVGEASAAVASLEGLCERDAAVDMAGTSGQCDAVTGCG